MRRLRAVPHARHESGRCDRCGHGLKRFTLGESHPDPVRFAFQGGYGSCFGDGERFEGEFCWPCINQLLGTYLHRQSPPLVLSDGAVVEDEDGGAVSEFGAVVDEGDVGIGVVSPGGAVDDGGPADVDVGGACASVGVNANC